MATRYKVTKDQLERIVESFVMEASIESKKAPVKNMIPSQAADAKKHVKNKMSGDMVDQSEGMPSVTPMKKKLSQASDAKKHMSKGMTKHTNKAKVVKEEETDHMDLGSGMEAITSTAIPAANFVASVLGTLAVVGYAAWKNLRNSTKEGLVKKGKSEEEAEKIVSKIDSEVQKKS